MQQQMRYEAEYFDDKKRLLRAIFNETLAQCNDALHKRNISKGKVYFFIYIFHFSSHPSIKSIIK